MQFKFRKKGKIKSIQTKLILIIVSFVVVCSLLLGAISIYFNYKSSNNVLANTVVETTNQASEVVSQKIVNLQNAAIQTGIIKEISDPKVSVKEKQSIITRQEKLYGLTLGQIIYADGKDLFSGKDYSERDYFKASMNGQAFLSSPVVSKVTGELIMVVSAPIWENGIEGSKIIGIVSFDVDKNFLNDMIANIKIGKNGDAYLIDSQGTTIADVDASLVGVENTIKESETDPSLKTLAEADKKLISGETGYIDVKYNRKDLTIGYAPIKSSNDWGIGIMVDKKDFLGEMYKSIISIGILAIVLLIIAFIIAKKLSNKIGNPLKECSERLKKLAEGDLDSETVIINTEDEIGLVSGATSKIVNDFREIINILTYVLTEISNGNLDVNVDDEKANDLFVNDFEPMLTAINKIVYSLNETLTQIDIAGEQVAVGSNQVAESAQVLSQGATEQASSIEELSATINEITSQINQTAQNAIRANKISEDSMIVTNKGKEQMKEMISAMDEISNASNKIGNIIKNIDDIAFQTNILALNAAIEAARAGEAGKGFAVVADEVRNLASKSAQSAKDIANLIAQALKSIENGTLIVSETANSLEEIVSSTQRSAKVIQEIADTTTEQAEHINQVNTGVEQISSVIQSNSATSEESAAASEELSSQAHTLKELMEHFNLKTENDKYEEDKYFDSKILFDNE